MRLTDLEWQTAKRVCTKKQLAALDLWRRGAGKHRIGLVLGIDSATAREHVKRGLKRVSDELEKEAAA